MCWRRLYIWSPPPVRAAPLQGRIPNSWFAVVVGRRIVEPRSLSMTGIDTLVHTRKHMARRLDQFAFREGCNFQIAAHSAPGPLAAPFWCPLRSFPLALQRSYFVPLTTALGEGRLSLLGQAPLMDKAFQVALNR